MKHYEKDGLVFRHLFCNWHETCMIEIIQGVELQK